MLQERHVRRGGFGFGEGRELVLASLQSEPLELLDTSTDVEVRARRWCTSPPPGGYEEAPGVGRPTPGKLPVQN